MTTKIKTFGGNIGIGTTDPEDFKLNVHGSLKTSSLVVNGVTDAQVPIGLIQLWYGSSGSIPSGWALCNGSTYTRTDGGGSIVTPDLRTKFIRGASGDNPSPLVVGTEGGSNTVTLGVANLASHLHEVSVDQGNANHSHGTTETDADHNHSVVADNAPHGHVAQNTNANHNHGLSDSNANHHHPSFAQDGAAHNHNTTNRDIGPHRHGRPNVGVSGPSPRYPFPYGNRHQSYRNNSQRSGNNNAPHTHTLDGTPGQQHSHSSNNNFANHSHEVGSNNTQHSHSATGNNQMPHSHTLDQGGAQHSHSAPTVNAPHGHSANVNNTGQGTPFSVLNAYYALFYIMKI